MAARFWIGGTGNWTDTAHWSATSGGTGGVSAPGSSDDVTFDSNSGTLATVTVDTAPQAALTVTINKVDLTLLCGFGLTVTNAMTLTTGILNTNGKTCSFGSLFLAGLVSRTLTLGASAITLTLASGNALTTNSTTNLTWTVNTATLTFTGANAVWFTTGINVNGTSVVFTPTAAGSQQITGASGTFQCANLTVTAPASKTNIFFFGCTTTTITSTLTLTGNSVANRLFAQSNALASTRFVNAAVVVLTNVDIQDVTAGGAASPFTGTSLGDCYGNVNITFDAPTTQTFTGGTKSWSDPTAWTSRVPLPQDSVVVATTGAGTLTLDMPRCGKDLDFTGYTRTLTQSVTTNVFGSFTLESAMTYNGAGLGLRFNGRGTHTITTAGKVLALQVTTVGPGGTYTLQDDFVTSGTAQLFIGNGTLDLNGKNVRFSSLADGSGVRSLKLGSGTFTLAGTGAVWTMLSASQTLVPGTAILDITDTSATAKTFAGGGLTYPTLRHIATGSAALTITGANTFASLDLECSTARTVTLPTSTQTVTDVLTLKGASAQLLSLVSATPGTAASIKASHWPMVSNPFVSSSVDVRLVHRQLNAVAAYQQPAVV